MKNTTAPIMLLLSLLLFFSLISDPVHAVNLTAVLAFGDSTLDSGNNNYLPTLIRANHIPNGCNFPGHVPTGRYSDGLLLPDLIASGLHLKSTLPAFLEPGLTPAELATGANFASAGAGLDDLTSTSSRVLTVDNELDLFEQYIGKLKAALGEQKTKRIVEDALVIISIGTNDMVNNFYMNSERRKNYTLAGYHDFLLKRMEYFIQRIYKLGARRISVANLPPIGCLPIVMTIAAMNPDPNHMFGKRECIEQKNTEAAAYNAKLQVLVDKMPSSLSGVKMAVADTYTPMLDMMRNPMNYGFIESRRGCCGTGLFEMGPTCILPFLSCPDTSKFMFWDSVHPTMATYKILNDRLMKTVIPKISA